jgi:ribosomal protein S27AE
MPILVQGTKKYELKIVHESMGILECCHIVLYQEIFEHKRPVCWRIVVKEKPNVGSQFFMAFPSDRFKCGDKGYQRKFIYSQ